MTRVAGKDHEVFASDADDAAAVVGVAVVGVSLVGRGGGWAYGLKACWRVPSCEWMEGMLCGAGELKRDMVMMMGAWVDGWWWGEVRWSSEVVRREACGGGVAREGNASLTRDPRRAEE